MKTAQKGAAFHVKPKTLIITIAILATAFPPAGWLALLIAVPAIIFKPEIFGLTV